MSRRIVYVFVLSACAVFAAPASADRECFDNTCRMPEVIEAPEAPAETPEITAVAGGAERSPAAPQPVSPQPISPQMIVDQLSRPALRPSPHRPVDTASDKAMRREPRRAEVSNEPVEVVNRRYTASDLYAHQPVQPNNRVVVVVRGNQYGADGIGLAEGRQNSAWELCQQDRPNDGRCSPYNYQPYGAYGYRPLGSYRPQRVTPAQVYVPDAKIVTIND